MFCNHDYDNKFEFKLTLSLIGTKHILEKQLQDTTQQATSRIGTILNLSYPWVGNLDWHKTKIAGNHTIYWIAFEIWMF